MATQEPPRRRRTPSSTSASGGEGARASATSSITALPEAREAAQNGHGGYIVPIVHLHLPDRMVNAGFWGVLIGSAALGVVDLPLAALIGGAVYVARHHAVSRA